MINFGNGCMAEIMKAGSPDYPWWHNEEAFDERVQRVAEGGCSQCEFATDCGLTIELDDFTFLDRALGRIYSTRAKVWGECNNEDCPRPGLVSETVINLAKDGEDLVRLSRARG